MRKLMVLFFLFALLSVFQVTADATSYTMVDLGPMITPVSINNRSVIVGYKTTPDGHRTAFYWSKNFLKDLGTFNGTDSEALDVNSGGQIVGTFTQNGSKRGYKLTGSGFTDLFTTAGLVEAVGINDSGVILGSILDPEYHTKMPALLQSGVLKPITGDFGRSRVDDFTLVGINNLSQIIFYQIMCDVGCEYSYFYSNGTITEIWPYQAADINNRSEAVGSQIESWIVYRGAIFKNGTTTIINDFGGDYTFPTAINDLGQIAGNASKPDNLNIWHAFVYQNNVMVDLNTLLPANSGWNLSYKRGRTVKDINNYGQIVGTGLLNGEEHAFLFSPQYSASGTVRVGSTTGPALAGATVSIAGSTATTNSAGYFSIPGILPGTYTVTIAKPGYYTKSVQLLVNKTLAGLVFYLSAQPYYSMSGTVHAGTSTGPALPGATVSIAGKTAVTGSTGTFTITGIPAGTYTLTISKFGYITRSVTGYVVNSNRSGLSFYLLPAPRYYISGTVRRGSTTGPVLPGARVSIAGKSTLTSSTGTFTISGIPAGTYTLTISKYGYTTRKVTGYVVNGNKSGLVFYLTPAPTYSISGTVRRGSTTGSVLPGATVSIAGKTAITSSTGTFSISGIPAGSYTLAISKTGYVTKTYTGYVISGNKSGLVYYLTLSPTASITGTRHKRPLAALPGRNLSC